MARRQNFLLGYGERLVENIAPPASRPVKREPYTVAQAVARLAPQVRTVASRLERLPSVACPGDEAVAQFVLHPSYIAKTYFPGDLLDAFGLESIGSRQVEIVPERTTRKDAAGEPQATTALYVAGKRENFRYFARMLERGDEALALGEKARTQLIRFESMGVRSPEERVQRIDTDEATPLLELVLHAGAADQAVVTAFTEYLESLGAEFDLRRREFVDRLCFIPARVPREQILRVAQFAFLRVVRVMPRLRPMQPGASVLRTAGAATVPLPGLPASDPSIRVAVFDGGLPSTHTLGKWARSMPVPGIGKPVPSFTEHGLAVTSAVLFGPLTPGEAPECPYAGVDHFQVLDVNTQADDQDELPTVLRRIRTVLEQRQYEFINLSIGPDLPIDDDEVHLWTAVLDKYLSTGRTLATIAVGNGGELDRASGNARVQTPADCVNALAVGAADSSVRQWDRAPYSSVGPGRSPGVIKPDVLAFGGSRQEPFFVMKPGASPNCVPSAGTSLAAPAALRTAVGIRSAFGGVLKPVALKALLLHSAEPSDDRAGCGWGRLPTDLESLVTTDDHAARIVYQGELRPGEWVRMPIPFPKEGLKGRVTLHATFCFMCGTDAHDPVTYTRSGLEVRFRPNRDARSEQTQRDANSKGFFSVREYYTTERQLRDDAHKWETCVHASKKMLGSSLWYPVFDVHYNARIGGRNDRGFDEPIPYSLVVTLSAPRDATLYNRIVAQYRQSIEPLKPVLQIPLRTRS